MNLENKSLCFQVFEEYLVEKNMFEAFTFHDPGHSRWTGNSTGIMEVGLPCSVLNTSSAYGEKYSTDNY